MRPAPGGPKTVLTDEAAYQILAATLTPPPESLRAAGVTHWSSRRLADWLARPGASASATTPSPSCGTSSAWPRTAPRGSGSPPARNWTLRSATSPACTWHRRKNACYPCFFPVITRQAIRRGSFASVNELISAIGAFTGHRNDHPRPFSWTKNADEILASIQRAKTNQAELVEFGS